MIDLTWQLRVAKEIYDAKARVQKFIDDEFRELHWYIRDAYRPPITFRRTMPYRNPACKCGAVK